MKTANPEDFNSLIELMDYFNTEQKCIDYFQFKRWGETVICPNCNHNICYKFKKYDRFKCAKCKKQFTVRIGTIFEGSKIPLRKWFMATYLIACHKKGISSHQLARDLKVTQKTAWFMLHRLRHKLGLAEDKEKQLEGTVQLDETFVGGKNKNRHADKKVENSQGRSFKDKTPVMGMLQEREIEIVHRPNKIEPDKIVKEVVIVKESIVVCHKVTDTKATSLEPIIRAKVKTGSILVSDEWFGYANLHVGYDHRIVDHRAKEYVNVNGDTSNAIEGFWTLFKRAYIGIYHYMSRKHLQLYADEVAYRYNTKRMKDCERWKVAIAIVDSPLKYKKLIGKDEKAKTKEAA